MRINRRVLKSTFLAAALVGPFLRAPIVQATATPTGLMGVATSASSIVWTWSAVSTATYNFYNVNGSTIPIAAGLGVTSYNDTGLSLNSPYTRAVTAVVGTTESVASSSVTVYTFAAAPGTPSATNVTSSSITLTWPVNGNGAGTAYVILSSTDSSFTNGIVTVVPLSANLTANTTNITNLNPATSYYFKVRAANGDGILTAASPIAPVTTSLPSGVTGGGTGTATVVPATVPSGGLTTSTITFTVPTGGMVVGGRIDVGVPANWGGYLQTACPTCNGYVSLISSTPATFSSLIPSATGVSVSLQSGFAPAGSQLLFVFQNMFVACPFAGQTAATWQVRSAMNNAAALQSIAGQPTQTYTAGAAQWIGFNTSNSFTTVANQPSPALVLQAYNNCSQAVALTSSVTINLSGLIQNPANYSYSADGTAQFSTNFNFSTTTNAVTIPALAASTTLYYQTATAGNVAVEGTYPSFTFAGTQQTWLYVTSLAAAPSFTQVAVDNGTPVSGQTQMTITPDGTGINNSAYIRFAPSTATQPWHVSISSNGFQTTVFERWGSGDPQSNVVWNGQMSVNGAAGYAQAIVPNGTYTVKIEFSGLGVNTALSIVVNTSQISGTVTYGGSPVAGAQISAQGAGVYNSVTSDVSGHYVINGLHAGSSYSLYASYINPANQSVVTGQINNVTAPSSGQNFSLSVPAVIRVAGVAVSSATSTVYGNLNMHSSDYSQNFFGNLRLQAGTTTTDNGDPFVSSTWTTFYVQPNTSYVLHVTMPGYGASDVTVANSTDVVLSLSRQANIYGVITLPAPAQYSQWVSVSGTLSGNNYATVWGGASFNVGQSTAIYSVYAVPAGNYSFVAQASGYVPSSLATIAVGVTDLGDPANGGEDFPVMSVGGVISGTLTINGDTSDLLSAPILYLNAYSPKFGYNVSTQVQVATSTTQSSASYQIGGVADGTYQMYSPYLQGFDSSVSGQQNVVVHNGVATVNITLTQETGQITGQIVLPNGRSDYANVHLSLQGPSININQDLSGATFTIPNLGTGFFNLLAFYKTTGAQSNKSINLTNGQTASVIVDLSAPTFAITGSVSIQSAFSVKGSTGTQVTINTITDLLANATNQTLYIGGTTVPGAAAGCNGTAITTTTARVEVFPKTFSSFSDSNRNGLINCYAIGGYYFGAINPDGSYSVPNLYPGVWQVDVYPYFDNGKTPNAAAQTQFITVTAGNVSGVNFSLSAGNSVSGTVNLPTGVSDSRQFFVQILDLHGNTIQTAFLQLGAAGAVASSANYLFSNLPAGQYSLLIQDPGSYDATLNQNVIKYVTAPVQFTINGADVTGLNVSMVRSARIVGTLGIQTVAAAGGATTLSLITPNNLSLLPNGFQISAQADPWIAGGFQSALFSNDGTNRPAIDANNHFTIDGLAAGTYNVVFQQNSYAISVQAAGGINLASLTQGSVIVTQGQTLDLGTIVLKPGLSLSGTVTDTAGNPLSNITVRATPSTNQHGQNSLQVTTDGQGNFTLAGLSPDLKIYDIVVAPRPGSNDSTPPVPYGQVSRLAVNVTQVPPPTLNFSLTSATSLLSGKIMTADGGPLAFPDSDQAGYPEAAVYLHLEGSTSDDNPLGQETATNLDGTFTIGELVPGIYDMTVESLGYQPYRIAGLVLGKGASKDVGTITLQKGGELDATLARPDGSLVNTNQVDTIVAVSQDLSSIIFGQATKDANSGNILSLKFSGFLTSPQSYNVLLFDKQNNITSPPEGRNLVFVSSTQVMTRALTYVQSAPFAFTDVKRAGDVGSAVSITYYFSRPLRNRGDDQDPSQWVSIVNGQGTLSSYLLSGDRTQLSVIYTPAAGEQNATLNFNAHTVDINPSTGIEFLITKKITLLLGQKATVESNINPALGGTLSLAQAQDPSNVFIPANALLTSTGAVIDATVSYSFTLTSTDDVGSIASSTPGHHKAAMASLLNYGAHAFVSEAYQAMNVAHTDVTINPLSSFYSILLPAGVSHSLNQTAYITLSYDSTADPNLINVYYFNGVQYLLENNQRTIDTVNHTITVGVSHFSTFVILQNNAPVIVTNGGDGLGTDIDVFNFPNPFDLKAKTLALHHPGSEDSITTGGTVIRYFVPAAKVGPATIRIYDVVGKKVRTMDVGTPAGDTYSYVAWDGANDAGRHVASGVYVGVLDVGGTKKFWKMAVIK